MTQLFDTNTYDARPDTAAAPRHLRSIPTGMDLAERSVQWHLDNDTIETARRGIALARQALKNAADAADKTHRKAA